MVIPAWGNVAENEFAHFHFYISDINYLTSIESEVCNQREH